MAEQKSVSAANVPVRLKEAWNTVEGWAKPGDTWTMLTSLLWVSLFALAISTAYGQKHSMQGAFLAFLASLTGFSIGGILGFLFGFPRYSDAAAVQSIEDLREALQNGKKDDAERTSRIRHSTNLERITDWLMTMIVGATVINLKDLSGWAESQFTLLATAIVQSGQNSADAPEIASSAAAGALLVLPFMVFGFLYLYLWARRYLPREWQTADDEIYGKKVQELAQQQKKHEEQIQKQEEVIGELQTKLYSVDATVLKRFQETALRLHANPADVDQAVARYRAASGWDDDPMKGFAAPQSGGLDMGARITKTGDPDNPFQVDLAIKRADGQPLNAAIFTLFHNSFDSPIDYEVVTDRAIYEDQIIITDGFTVGALVVLQEGNEVFRTVRLALNLEELPNLPEGFVRAPADEKK